ncbi:hypothetical protein HAX54_053446 [Datura stramonium]|uniref:Uncharacterized protein n=1 Tax=Datura stramonium TaxID=4076 RepID=A0ABS8T0F0_DATST|nr:hypothetical protein [Datura stramonium]
MENNEEGEEITPSRNEWEVVSLTLSAYAAAPDSRQRENAALQPDNDEILSDQGSEDAIPEFNADKGVNSDTHEVSTKTKGVSMEFPGDQMFDEKVSILSLSGAEFEEDVVLMDKEQNFFSSTTYSSFHSEELMGVPASTEESNMLAEPVEPFHQGIDSGISNFPKAHDEDNDDAENLPCQAWWKRQAVSLVSHAKDANTFWSVFIAAAVVGLVVIGQRWQLERWQVLQMKWQFGGHDVVKFITVVLENSSNCCLY